MASPVRFAVVKKMFEDRGWLLARVRGSHHIFSKTGKGSYPVPVHNNRVKAAYVEKIKQFLADEG